ncbi:hypothetical protein NKG94_49460 [Micromonospora sp. M12]
MTAVVWAVSVIRSVRLRALVYSLPLPMTLALVSTDHRVDGAQLLGVLGLNLFFVTVAVTHHRLRWPILLADGAGSPSTWRSAPGCWPSPFRSRRRSPARSRSGWRPCCCCAAVLPACASPPPVPPPLPVPPPMRVRTGCRCCSSW